MKAIPLPVDNVSEALDVLAALKADVESGKVIGFAAVALTQDDTALAYCTTTRFVSRLRVQGAIAQLQHNFLNGDI